VPLRLRRQTAPMSGFNHDGEVVHKYLDGFRGALHRKLPSNNTWKPRFFVLENKKLRGYKDSSLAKLIGDLVVNSDTTVYDMKGEEDGRTNFFYVKGSSDDVLYLSADTPEEKAVWMEAIFDAVSNGFKVISQPKLKLGEFIPRFDLQVTYRNEAGLLKVNNGNNVKPSQVQKHPQIAFRSGSGTESCCTLMMFDLDSIHTNVDNRVAYLQWAVVNITGADIGAGHEVTAYEGPLPDYNSGTHRYFFLVFDQTSPFAPAAMKEVEQLVSIRQEFSYIAFMKQFQLDEPIGINGFYSQWDESCDALHAAKGYSPPSMFMSPAQAEAARIDRLYRERKELYLTMSLVDIFASMDITHSKVPSLELTVEYDGGHFAFEGHKIEVKFCTEAPTVSYDPHTPDSLYTLLIVDPDAPSRMKPTEREYVQWMVVNIKGDNVEGGQIVLPYQGPSPPHKSGLHRYVIQLYKQNGEFNARQIEDTGKFFQTRSGLSGCEWVRQQGRALVDVPCGIEVFLSEWDKSVDALHEAMGYSPPEQYQSPSQARAILAAQVANSSNSLGVPVRTLSAFDERRKKILEAQDLFNAHVSTTKTLKDQSFFEAEDEDVPSDVPLPVVKKRVSTTPRGPMSFTGSAKVIDASNAGAATMMDEAKSDADVLNNLASPENDIQVVQEKTQSKSESTDRRDKHSETKEETRTVDVSEEQEDEFEGEGGEEVLQQLQWQMEERKQVAAEKQQKLIEDSQRAFEEQKEAAREQQDSYTRQHEDSVDRLAETHAPLVAPLLKQKSESSPQKNKPNAANLCQLFGVQTLSIFDAEIMKKKFTGDNSSKDSYVWITPRTKSLHWGKSKGDAKKSKFILLDPLGADPAELPLGDPKGILKRVRNSGANLLVTTESGETLELKLSTGGDPPASKRALDWTKAIKAFSPS